MLGPTSGSSDLGSTAWGYGSGFRFGTFGPGLGAKVPGLELRGLRGLWGLGLGVWGGEFKSSSENPNHCFLMAAQTRSPKGPFKKIAKYSLPNP